MPNREIKLSVPDDLLDTLNAEAEQRQITRAHLIRDIVTTNLSKAHTRFPAAVTGVLKIADGKLTRMQAEHITAVVIKEING